jgi:DNA-binding LacI/PurR family transcriptional regulator
MLRTVSIGIDASAFAAGVQAMARLLERPDPPDAVCCFSDPLALGSLRTLLTRGLRVPEDIAVVGFDDVEDGQFSVPSLTTVSPDKRFIAGTALASLSARLNGTAPGEGTQTIAPHVRPPSTGTEPFFLGTDTARRQNWSRSVRPVSGARRVCPCVRVHRGSRTRGM